jgi:hypothetical protein
VTLPTSLLHHAQIPTAQIPLHNFHLYFTASSAPSLHPQSPNMHWSALTLLFAATVLGAPAPIPADVELSITPEQRFQGDGFYLAVFDDAGVANVTFTPKADLLARSAAPVSENLAARAVNTLSKRKTVCAGRSTHVGDLDWANVQLANNGNNKWYNKGAWGWVRRLSCFTLRVS